jgi:hypothetical protein
MMKRVKFVLLIAAVLYAGVCALLFLAQRKLIYYASRQAVPLPEGFTPWTVGGNFIGYKSEKGSDRALLFFQGNGGNASGWSHSLLDFPGDVFCLEYPGYGERPGTPSEKAICQAAIDAFDALPKGKEIVVCGQSLGTGVAGLLMRHRTVPKLILLTPFTSLADIASSQYPFVPVGLLLKDRYPVWEAWLQNTNPSCVFVAENDEIIPRSMSQKFLDNAGKNRQVAVIPNVSHNDVQLDRAEWTKPEFRD